MVTIGNPDVLLIEGYKSEVGDKVVLLRNREDWDTLRQLQGRQLFIGCPEITTGSFHIHSREQVEQIDEMVFEVDRKG